MIGNIKHIVVFQSLSDGDPKTGMELYSDYIKRRIDFLQNPEIKMTHDFHDIRNKEELIEKINYYQSNTESFQGGLLFHFEMHGDIDCRGLVLANRDLVTWGELVDLFRPINIKTGNKLFITMATCNGRDLYLGIKSFEKSPYSGYISTSETVYPDEIITVFGLLFEKLIECGNIVAAYFELAKTGSNFCYKDLETSFEEAFKHSVLELKNNNSVKEDTLRDTEIKTGKRLSDEEIEMIFMQVVNDLYKKHKKTFEF